MLKDNWEEKHRINLVGHTTCAKGVQATHMGNTGLQTPQRFSDNGYLAGSSRGRSFTALAPSGSTPESSIPQRSNLQVGNSLLVLNGQGIRCGVSINEPKSVELATIQHRFDNHFHQQNRLSENRPTFIANLCGNGNERTGNASSTLVMETHKPVNTVCSQAPKSNGTDSGKSLIDSNVQELIKFLSASHGLPMKMPLETGSPEYLKLVEILQQNSVQPNGFSDGLNGSGASKQSRSYLIVGGRNNAGSVEIASLGSSTEQVETSRTINNGGQFGSATNCFFNKSESINGGHEEETIKAKEMIVAPSDESSICRDDNKEKIVGCGQKNDPILGPLKMDEKKLPSQAEKLWDGSLQLSSSVTLSAAAFFKSGEKLLGDNWPEFIEVKGKVRFDAFEKYVQDLPRSRNRGLMVISLCWKEGSSDTGLTGMKEVAKGYKKSSRVGFAQLLSGIDLYICPRSDPIITILAKYGFFKGMSVIDDKQDSMIGCVVWRKNRPLNPVETQNPSSISTSQCAEKKLSPEKLGLEAGQRDEPAIAPLSATSGGGKNVAPAEVHHNGGNPSCNLVRKRAFEDDDLPEFDFGIACGKSTLENQPVNRRSTVDPARKGTSEQSSKKTKLFDDDDDDMPEWCPPELHNQIPPSKFKNLPSCPPRPPPIPPPPPADTRSSISYQPFQPPIGCTPRAPPAFARAPPPSSSSGGFSRHRLNPSNVNQLFPSSNGRRPRP